MKKYNKQDIIHVLKGSAFLGAGGGGSYEYGMKLLTQLENMGYTPEFDLYDVDEMEAGAYACMVAALGKPTAIDPTELSSDLPAAYRLLPKPTGTSSATCTALRWAASTPWCPFSSRSLRQNTARRLVSLMSMLTAELFPL